MTELQIRIRKLSHQVSSYRKRGKDVTELLATLADLRNLRVAERHSKKSEGLPAAQSPATPTVESPETADAH